MPRSATNSTISAKEYDHWRASAEITLRKKAFYDLPRDQFYALELFPGVQVGANKYVIPKSMVPAGRAQQLNMRTVDLTAAIPEQLLQHPERVDMALHSLRVTVAALLMIPRTARGRRGFLPKPTTWAQTCKRLIKFARWAIENRSQPDTLFAHLTKVDLEAAVSSTAREIGWAISDISKLRASKSILDWPNILLELNDTYKLVGMDERIDATRIKNRRPRARSDEAPTIPEPRNASPHLPLSDTFISEAGWRILWLLEDLGPNIVRLNAGIARLDPDMHWRARRKQLDLLFGSCQWVDRHGKPLSSFPFPLEVAGNGIAGPIRAVPDVTGEVHVSRLVHILQLSHIYVTSFCMGARSSEVFSLPKNCLDPATDALNPGLVTGRTYKFVDAAGGLERDWPMHPIGVFAIQQQIELSHPIRRQDNDSLWVQMRASSTGELKSVKGDTLKAVKLNRLVEAIGLKGLLDHDGLYIHRFRKTLARLCALALVGAPKVLMELFGHKSVDEALYYMLTDRELAAEVDQMAKDLIVLRGAEVIENIDDVGGPAGERLRHFIATRPMLAETDAGVTSIKEMARLITMNGNSWTMPRPNIVCTKGPFQAGPCTRKVGHPDGSRCQPDCDHRLELQAALNDADESIQYCIQQLAEIEEWTNDYEAIFWIGQLRHHLARFPDLVPSWVAHPVMDRLGLWEAEHGLRQ